MKNPPRADKSDPPRAFGRPPIAALAQLVEHLIRNEGVGGSNPSSGTKPIFDNAGIIRVAPGADHDHVLTTFCSCGTLAIAN